VAFYTVSSSLIPPSWFKGVLLLRGGEGKIGVREEEREGEGKEGKGMGRKGRKESKNLLLYFFPY